MPRAMTILAGSKLAVLWLIEAYEKIFFEEVIQQDLRRIAILLALHTYIQYIQSIPLK